MIVGMIPTVALSVVSWASVERMPPGMKLTLEKELAKYCLTMFSAQLVTNHTYGIAFMVGGMYTTVIILKMLVLTVTDISGIQRSKLDCKI